VLLTGVKGPRRGLERYELAEKYEPVDRDDARAWWDAEYAKTPATETQRFHILGGAVFPIYDKIMGSSGIQSVRIARAVLTDGTALALDVPPGVAGPTPRVGKCGAFAACQGLVGLNLSPSDVPGVKQRLGIGTPLAEATPGEILDMLAAGAMIELDNGWPLTRGSGR
jgi:hypothetical protein